MNIIVFDGGVYVGKNTSRPANVRGISRKPRALQQGAFPSPKILRFWAKIK